ncbi:MAG TPA: hypothetical protein VII96_05235 [Acidimicrobiales bacterium]
METGPEDPDKPPQGWFVDPFGIHELRWFSQGSPTALVRDGRTETQDPPPDRPVPGPLVRGTVPSRPGPAGSDPRRADSRDRDVQPGSQVDFTGSPARTDEVGMPTMAPLASTPGRTISAGTDGAPLTPKRIVRTRWVAFGFAVVWTLLLTGLLCTATTTTYTGGIHGPRHSHTQSVLSADTSGVIAFVAMLVVAVAVTGVGFVRRLRAESEAPGRAGYVFAGILGVLGVLSLATIGLALIILGAALAVVARPLKKPRPLPGEQVA